MSHLPRLTDPQLEALLDDDSPLGDLTTWALGIGDVRGAVQFQARGAMVVACVAEAARLFELCGATATMAAADGDHLAAGGPILAAAGTAAALHRAWKPAQILVEWASGVATRARKIVAAADGAPVVCTRKTAPWTKAAAIRAIYAGGAAPHRLGLSETFLMFAEHRLFSAADAATLIAGARKRAPEKKIVVEAHGFEEAVALAQAGADVVQLDKAPPDLVAQVKIAVAGIVPRPLIAAAGGVTEANAAEYVRAGADILVTSAPYAAPPLDVATLWRADDHF